MDACQQAVSQKAELENNLSAAQGRAFTGSVSKTELAAALESLKAGQSTIDQSRTQLDSESAKLAAGERELALNEKL